ncbi:hypothetical protein QJS04_geneDACA008454 [Acorus gramineus]|uniref:Uncharacterized protein n=1 Tax=Acorus gramineus TaxID=55184 RepID=A0AAV9AH84_ACOGR|nr:hypothetical protein QJS04_geneDACA008454 [Acorus gramineus]
MFRELALLLLVVLLGYVYQAIQPPPPNICGSPSGPKLTSPRVTLSDGRHLAYKETGTPREEANHKVVVVHAFDGGKESIIPVSPVLTEPDSQNSCSVSQSVILLNCVVGAVSLRNWWRSSRYTWCRSIELDMARVIPIRSDQ